MPKTQNPVTLKERLDGPEGVELASGVLNHTKSFRASARQISQLAKAGFFVPYSLGSATESPVFGHLRNRALTRLKPTYTWVVRSRKEYFALGICVNFGSSDHLKFADAELQRSGTS